MNHEQSDDSVTILLADGYALFREAVAAVLAAQPDFQVVAGAANGLQAVAEAERARPTVAVVEWDLGECDGIQATYLIKDRIPDCRVIIVTSREDQTSLVEAVEAGADGYLTKDQPLTELVNAIRAVARGETRVPARLLGPLLAQLIHRRSARDEAHRLLGRLTNREREVLGLLAQGADNDAIAEALVISPQTARTHIQNVLSKLDVHSRLEAAAFVNQNGILGELERTDR